MSLNSGSLTIAPADLLNRTIVVLGQLTLVDLTTANTRGPVTFPTSARGSILLFALFDTFSAVGANQPINTGITFQYGTDSTTAPFNIVGSTNFPANSSNPFVQATSFAASSPYVPPAIPLYFRIGTGVAAQGTCTVTFFGVVLS